MKSVQLISLISTLAISGATLQCIAEDNHQPNRPKVTTSVISNNAVTQWVMTQGRASAIRHEYLNFERSGKVRYIAKDENGRELRAGDVVRGPIEGEHFGQLLAQLDSREDLERVRDQEAALVAAQRNVDSMKSALQQSKTSAEQALKDYQRAKTIFAKGAYSQGDLDKIKTKHINADAETKRAQAALASSQSQVKSAVAQLNSAKIGLEKTSIFAPFNGFISYLNIRQGDYSTGQPNQGDDAQKQSHAAIVVVDNSTYEITLEVPFYQADYLAEGQLAYIANSNTNLTQAANEGFKADNIATGKVYSVSPSISLAGRTVQIKVRADKNISTLRDGLPVTVWIASQYVEDVTTISEAALEYRGIESFTYVVNEKNIIEKRRLTLGLEGLQNYQVLTGVKVGERVVVGGSHLVFDGSQVEVIKSDTRSEAGAQ